MVYACLQANPSLGRADGLGALAAPIAALFPDSEASGFLVLQRLLHGFMWQFYSQAGLAAARAPRKSKAELIGSVLQARGCSA